MTILLSLWYSPELCIAIGQIYFEYALKVLVPKTNPYHNRYEIMISTGARRLVLIDIDEDVDDVDDVEDVSMISITIIIATEDKIGHETMSKSLIEGGCLLVSMCDNLTKKQQFLHTKDTMGEITYAPSVCSTTVKFSLIHPRKHYYGWFHIQRSCNRIEDRSVEKRILFSFTEKTSSFTEKN
ncbi:unnamed protein product [Albugo candida]|uniref:Uncharacterized protein n=1 Tax=Albugo candida TaxID=65357 RepID=A0A024FX99_9STRA|nr:unnamed protein product [Albugo candida]|eukprot:CCI11750.1 unnamed protein product [Albugo candida]